MPCGRPPPFRSHSVEPTLTHLESIESKGTCCYKTTAPAVTRLGGRPGLRDQQSHVGRLGAGPALSGESHTPGSARGHEPRVDPVLRGKQPRSEPSWSDAHRMPTASLRAVEDNPIRAM